MTRRQAAGSWLERALLIRPDEVAGTLFLAGNALFASAAVIALARVATSRSVERMPWWATMMVPVAVLASLVGYLLLARRYPRGTVSIVLTVAATAGLLACAAAGRGHDVISTPMVVIAGAAIIYKALAVPIAMHAGALAMDVWGLSAGFRLVPWLGAGIGAGAWCGRWLVIRLYAAWGSVGAIVLATVCVVIALLLTRIGSRFWPREAGPDQGAGAMSVAGGREAVPWRYLAGVGCLVFLSVLAVACAESLWHARVLSLADGAAALEGSKADVRLIGGGVALLLQVTVLARWFRAVSVSVTLLVLVAIIAATLLPLALLGGAHVPLPLSWTPVAAAALETPLFAVYFVLFLPLARSAKYGSMLATWVLAGGTGTALAGAVTEVLTPGVLTSQQAAMIGIAACLVAVPAALYVGSAFSRMAALEEGARPLAAGSQ